MSLTAEIVIRYAVSIAIGLVITLACYAVLSTFIWWWLAAILAGVASYYVEGTEAVVTVKARSADIAVAGAAKALNWYRALRAPQEAA